MNILERLKHGTRAEHLALEASLPLLRPDLTLEQYAAVLRAFAGVVLPLERRLAALLWPAALDYPARRHTPALQADLGALGLSAPEFALPHTLATTLPAAYGTLYVLEGSTLGGQLIRRHLKQHLKLDTGSGAAYFSGYGPDTGAKWRAFGQVVLECAQSDSPVEHRASTMADEIVQEARMAFGAFAAAVAGWEVL